MPDGADQDEDFAAMLAETERAAPGAPKARRRPRVGDQITGNLLRGKATIFARLLSSIELGEGANGLV